jgi:hypothetical protein
MTYILTCTRNTIVAYPYNLGMLRRDQYPSVIAANPTDADLAAYNMFPVARVAPGPVDPLTQDLTEGTPVYDSESGWRQVWIITNVSAEVEAQRRADALAAKLNEVRSNATRLLNESNDYVLEAFETSRELHVDFVSYRNALRNISVFSEDPFIVVYPSMPERIFVEIADLPEDFEDNL